MVKITNPIRFVSFVVGVVLLGVVILSAIGWGRSTVRQDGTFVVDAGQSAPVIFRNLKEQGYISGTFSITVASRILGLSNQLQAGSYSLEEGESVVALIRKLSGGGKNASELAITFPEGLTIQQMAEKTASSGIGTQDEFILSATPALFGEQFPFVATLSATRTLEGYLFPDTYRVFKDDSPQDIVQRMLTAFEEKVIRAGLLEEAQASGRSFDDIIIMASIIEREVISDEDMALVSGVLWKRLDENIGLAADATTRYALEKWDEPLTVVDLQIDSPYNTRKYAGLPPGPISNPGLRAIIAAIRPQESEYYYYLSAPSGETIFSKTNDEHNANKARYLQ